MLDKSPVLEGVHFPTTVLLGIKMVTIMLKGKLSQEAMLILNMYIPTKNVTKHLKQKLRDMQGENKQTIIVVF